jgi:hypothetical protein
MLQLVSRFDAVGLSEQDIVVLAGDPLLITTPPYFFFAL